MNQANEDMNQRSIVLDNFLVEVRGFSPSPLLILIFGDTIIAGDSRIDFCFVWNGWSYDMVAFVFAKDERRAKVFVLSLGWKVAGLMVPIWLIFKPRPKSSYR
ncbi:hypothetical protein WN943_025522 [Citrus x changshan-huyou]